MFDPFLIKMSEGQIRNNVKIFHSVFDAFKLARGYICVVPLGKEDNPALAEQINKAKTLEQPLYVVLPLGAKMPEAIIGATINETFYVGPSERDTLMGIYRAKRRQEQDYPWNMRKSSPITELSDIA